MSEINHFDVINRIDLDMTPSRAAAYWQADSDSLKLVNRGINVVYRFNGNGQSYYLKLTHANLKSRATLEANWDFLQHLANSGAPVSAPVPAADGQKVVAVLQGKDTFLATVTQAMSGNLLPEEMLPDKTFSAWGRALAQLHDAATTFQPADPDLFPAWLDIWVGIHKLIEPDDHAALNEFEQISAWFRDISKDTQNFGLTHADFRAGNMLAHAGHITIIDFDEPVWHWYPADMARPFLELAEYAIADRRNALSRFVRGYRSTRPLDEFWVESLSWFMRMKTLDIYAWSAAHWDARQDLTRKEWLAGFQYKFAHPADW